MDFGIIASWHKDYLNPGCNDTEIEIQLAAKFRFTIPQSFICLLKLSNSI